MTVKCKEDLNVKKILAVINATYAVSKRKPEKIRLAGIRTLTSAIPVQCSSQVSPSVTVVTKDKTPEDNKCWRYRVGGAVISFVRENSSQLTDGWGCPKCNESQKSWWLDNKHWGLMFSGNFSFSISNKNSISLYKVRVLLCLILSVLVIS